MILKGHLSIEFRDERVELQTGDIYVVPRGIEHNPSAKQECLVMIIENMTALHTGDVRHENSKSIEQQLEQ
jgi:mannose-6-phosphate isomerase-like protein (cupin superfamily)